MKKYPIALRCGVAVMLLTVILYFTILGDVVLEAIHFIALLAILLAEGVTTARACTAKGSPRRVAGAVASAFVVPYAMILSVVYIVNFPTGYGAYLGLYFAGVVIANLIASVLSRVDSAKTAEDAAFQDAKSNMLGLRKIAKAILVDPAAAQYAGRIRALEEKLHFSNDNVIAPEDENIRHMLLQLQSGIADPEFDCEKMLTDLEKAIDLRNISTSRTV